MSAHHNDHTSHHTHPDRKHTPEQSQSRHISPTHMPPSMPLHANLPGSAVEAVPLPYQSYASGAGKETPAAPAGHYSAGAPGSTCSADSYASASAVQRPTFTGASMASAGAARSSAAFAPPRPLPHANSARSVDTGAAQTPRSTTSMSSVNNMHSFRSLPTTASETSLPGHPSYPTGLPAMPTMGGMYGYPYAGGMPFMGNVPFNLYADYSNMQPMYGAYHPGGMYPPTNTNGYGSQDGSFSSMVSNAMQQQFEDFNEAQVTQLLSRLRSSLRPILESERDPRHIAGGRPLLNRSDCTLLRRLMRTRSAQYESIRNECRALVIAVYRRVDSRIVLASEILGLPYRTVQGMVRRHQERSPERVNESDKSDKEDDKVSESTEQCCEAGEGNESATEKKK